MVALIGCGALGLCAAPAGAAKPSSGCGVPPHKPPQAFEVAGQERQAIVVLPKHYRADRAHALICAFHGRTNDNARARRYFGLEHATDMPTIYFCPARLPDRTGRFTWADAGDPPNPLREFALFDATPEGVAIATARAGVVSDLAERELGYRPSVLRTMVEDSWTWLRQAGLVPSAGAALGADARTVRSHVTKPSSRRYNSRRRAGRRCRCCGCGGAITRSTSKRSCGRWASSVCPTSASMWAARSAGSIRRRTAS